MLQTRNSEKGQSTIEFILTFSITLLIVVVFIKASFTIVNGYVIHYATFMASRSFLVWDTASATPDASDIPAFNKAKEVFGKIIKQSNSTLQSNMPGDVKTIYVGVWYEYKEYLSASDILGGREKMALRSESFLGRAPTVGTCYRRICAAMEAAPLSAVCGKHTTMYDNGC